MFGCEHTNAVDGPCSSEATGVLHDGSVSYHLCDDHLVTQRRLLRVLGHLTYIDRLKVAA